VHPGREFVLDSSVTMVWGLEDESAPYAEAILDDLPRLRAHVPSLWPLEVANVLLVGERRGRLTVAESANFLSVLATFPITVDDETTARAWGATVNLARDKNLSIYDASYLELAMRRGLPLASLDERLRAVAAGVGVLLFVAA
jgi:predicted nucleic acid-binding protein